MSSVEDAVHKVRNDLMSLGNLADLLESSQDHAAENAAWIHGACDRILSNIEFLYAISIRAEKLSTSQAQTGARMPL